LKIYILGAGGFARETFDIYIDLSREDDVIGFLEENCKKVGQVINGKKIDDVNILNNLDRDEVNLICAIGSPMRKRLVEYTEDLGFHYDTVIHPSATKSRWVSIGRGCIICGGSIFTTQIEVGEHTIVNLNCTVGHDVRIGKYTTVSPATNISGRVRIGDGCFVGTNASIAERVSIGNGSFIGAGSVVTSHVPDNTLAYGVPARPIRKLEASDWEQLV
jgi:sugar O-acyltransferase (sialic acid O-acetyltransferase NeuD family)